MATLTTVKAFKGSAKTKSLTCETCGSTITTGVGYCHWTNHRPFEPESTTKHVRCMDPACAPRPSELEGDPKRMLLLDAREKVEVRLGEISVESYGSPHELLDDLRAVSELVSNTFSEVVAKLHKAGSRRPALERRAQAVEAGGRRLRMEMSFEPYPQALNQAANEHQRHDDASPGHCDVDRNGWRHSCLEVVRRFADESVDLL